MTDQPDIASMTTMEAATELAQLAAGLNGGRALASEHLDAAMAEMDLDGSGAARQAASEPAPASFVGAARQRRSRHRPRVNSRERLTTAGLPRSA